MDIPESYRQRMQELLGDEFPDYLASMDQERETSLRVNTLRWNVAAAEEELSDERHSLTPVPWVKEGFYYQAEDWRPAKTPYWHAGMFYLQEASAMTPGDVLPVHSGDRILDLCAAPGGKSTQTAARLHGTGVLYANDISASRAQALLKNLEMAGAGNIFVTAETPEKLSNRFPEYFDGILVDAPCSGEGMIRKDSSMFKDWLEKGPSFYQPIQADILRTAYRMLRPGGYMLYSTCTFSREEDEDNIASFLKDYPDMMLETIPLRTGFTDGFMAGTVRLWPHHTRGEGHFLALMKKAEDPSWKRTFYAPSGHSSDSASADVIPRRKHDRKGRRDSQEMANSRKTKESVISRRDFPMEAMCKYLLKGRYLELQGDKLYAIPDGEKIHSGIHYLRTGLYLGEWKKDKFQPSQALAMVLHAFPMDPDVFPHRVDLDWMDDNVIRYLKGETIFVEENQVEGDDGWVLVAASGHPLGWAQRKGLTLKNKYAAGWRMQ